MTSIDPRPTRNWFEQGGGDYARFRPEYPSELADFLASMVPDLRLAVDVGCGNGQLTRSLASCFDRVVGLDPSADQIANAIPNERITYQCAPAEKMPMPDHSASLITAAQAAHWFDLHAFYQEVRRVGIAGGVLALISYGVLRLEPDLECRFQRFYWEEIASYWPAQRKLVDEGYATMDFPFEEFEAPSMEIRLEWDSSEFLGYLLTWSAVQHAREAGRMDVLNRFAEDISELWGDERRRRSVAWPINMRVGRL